jgi:hypothetical protein
MPDRYWVGGGGTWTSINTANWSSSSGGPAGASVPTASDNVFFDSNSGTGVVTYSLTTQSCLNLSFVSPSGNYAGTFAGNASGVLFVYGNLTLSPSMTYTSNAQLVFNALSGSYTITSNGKTGPIRISLAANVNTIATWSLADSFGSTGLFIIASGTFNTNNYAFTASGFTVGFNTSARVINFGSSTVTVSGSVSINNLTLLTFNAGTSQINLTGATSSISSAGLTFYNVSFTSAAATSISITGANTFNTLSFAGRTSVGITLAIFSANQTITTLTLNPGTAAAYRTFLRSDATATQRTLSVATLTAGAADYDFRDIAITGAAAPIAPTRAGDCKGNSGITFPAAKTVWWRTGATASWGDPSPLWSLTNGGGADAAAFPLAQDTAIFPSSPTPYPSTGQTITINANYNIGTIDMSARTSNTMTLATGVGTPAIYGNWINGTGTTITGSATLIFSGRTTQQLTSAGKTFTQQLSILSPGGALVLQDAVTTSSASASALNLVNGTFDANGFNVTLSATASGFNSSFSNIRTIAIGSGTWTISGTGGWNAATSTNLSVTGTGTISLTSASAKTFAGGGIQTYPTLNQGGTGALTISGSNKFTDITNTAIAPVRFTGGTTNEFDNFNLNGIAGNLLILGSTNTTQAILKKPTTWNVGANSVDSGNNTGLFFLAGGTNDYLNVSYINGQTTAIPYYGNFLIFFS